MRSPDQRVCMECGRVVADDERCLELRGVGAHDVPRYVHNVCFIERTFDEQRYAARDSDPGGY